MRQRVITALLLAVPALFALALRSDWPLMALGLVAVFIGGREADRLCQTKIPICTVGAVVAYAPMAWSFPTLDVTYLIPAAFLASATCFGVSSAALRLGVPDLMRLFAGLWVAFPLLAILLLHEKGMSTNTGTWMLSPALMALVPVWAGDIAAIFVGKAFGKHPLAPKISPNKTVEGSLGNLLAAILAAWLLGRLLGVSEARSLGAGFAVGILGQLGDLFESWLKRRAGLKDSGTLLPGHGGVLDRIDSVLFAAPAVALILLR